MQKAQEETAGADEALAKLQSQLASHEKAKQSMQCAFSLLVEHAHTDLLCRIKYVPDSSKLPPPVKQTAATLKQQSVKTNSHSFLKKSNNNRLLNHDTTRSMPASPSLGPGSALGKTVNLTSIPGYPNGKNIRLQALRTPLIHLLAARPASAKLLTQHLGCKQEEILEVLQKVGKPYRLDDTKWDLTDKAFKELDVWNFEYPNQEDRELAINRARSAFDRMRLSTQEKIWDKLLPKDERGKGKILSHLNLHKGPIQKPTTPKIHVQHSSNESKPPQAAGDESDQKDRLAPSDAEPMARSKSHGPIKKTKVSEKEAQSKRLLSNGPKKMKPETKPKEVHPAAKKGGSQKKTAPKSSEFVNDSDEEDGLDVTMTNSPRPHEPESNGPVKKSTKPVESHSVDSTPKVNGITKAAKAAESSKPSLPVKTNDTKPTKKSSETTRKDIESNGKLIGKDTKNDKKASVPAKSSEKKALASGASTPGVKNRLSDASPSSTAMKKSLSRQRTTSSPHKPSPLGSSPPTNASDFENPGRSSSSSTPLTTHTHKSNATPNGVGLGINGHTRNSSDQPLKRKACDLDSDIHNHGSPLANGVTNGYVNGYMNGTVKRQKTSDGSPHSDSSDELLARDVALKKAQDFKKYYANYEKQYVEISHMENPPQEKIDELMKMHRRLAELKDQITSGLIGV